MRFGTTSPRTSPIAFRSRLRIDLHDGDRIQLPIPVLTPQAEASPELRELILQVLGDADRPLKSRFTRGAATS